MSPHVHPLTSAARGIWLGQTLNPKCRAYWTAEYLELNGDLDVFALARAVDWALREAETLHQRVFQEAGELFALIDVPSNIPLLRGDLTAAEAQSALNEPLPEVPDLRQGPLFAVKLIHVTETLHYLHLRVHHLALDGSGFGLLYQRLFQCYALFRRGITPAFETRPLDALVRDERDYQSSPARDADRAHFSELLQGAGEPTALAPLKPLGPRPRVRRSHLPAERIASGLSKQRELHLETVSFLLATLGCWLWEQSGRSEHVLGLAVAGRYSAQGLKSPCMAMNIIAVRVSVQPQATLTQLARSIQEQLRQGRRHQRYRYEDLRAQRAESGIARPFGVVLNYMPFAPPPSVEGISISRQPLAAGPVEDLALSIVAQGSGWRCDVEGHPDAYDDATLSGLEASWLQRLDSALAEPERVIAELFASTKRASRLLDDTVVSPIDVLERLQHHAHFTPRARAVDCADLPGLDYAGLLKQVQHCAGALRQRGIGPGDRVALLLRRLPTTIIAQLAVLWVGGAYVPIDPDGPKERLLRVLSDAEPALVVSDAADHDAFGSRHPWMAAHERGEALERTRVADSSPAYLIFTSGSTGTPNGVEISRGALAHFTAAALERYGIHASDRVLQFSPLQFDASVEEIHLTLAVGATLVLRTDAMLESLARFAAACQQRAVSVLDLPTAFWHELVDAPSSLLGLGTVRLWIIGGEAAHPEKVLRHFQRFGTDAQLINSYGPTEATVVCATAALSASDAGASVTIGGPLPGVELLVLDEDRNVVEQGRPGQLAVLGPTIASGYFGREDLTNARFVALPAQHGGKRAYLTGDRVLLDEHAELVFLGRFDDELKLSGHRVQPLEIELALSELQDVLECAVVVERADAGAKLAAYYVSAQPIAVETLRAALRTRVHPAAVPSHFQQLTRLPRDANGKVDRRALRKLVPEAKPLNAALSAWEETVAAAFAEVLGRPVSAPDSDFFALGGHSLAALQLVSRLTRSAGFDVALSQVFEHSTVRGLANALLAGPKATSAPADPLAPHVVLREGTGATVFCVHPADGLAYCYWGLGAHWPGVRLIGLQPWALRHRDVATTAVALERHAQLITELVPTGPIHLLGYSSGGGLAFELAHMLQNRGREIRTLAMLDSFPADIWSGKPQPTLRDALVSMLDDLDASGSDASGALVSIESLFDRLTAPNCTLASFDRATLELMAQVALEGMLGYRALRHATWDGELVYFAANQGAPGRPTWRDWLPYLSRDPHVIEVPTFHLGMTQPQILEQVARVIWPRLQTSS